MISTIGTTIATSVAQVMTKNNKKKIFVTKRATTMLGLYSSYTATDKNGDKILIVSKFADEFEQVLNTKGKHEAIIGFQTHLTAKSVHLNNLDDPSMISLYMDVEPETYNTVRVEKLKTFHFLDDNLNNTILNYDEFISVFNYLRVDVYTNLAFEKMAQSNRVARQDAELETDIQKRVAAPKMLFVDGEQRTLKDYMNLIANIAFEFHAMFKYLEEAIIYKMLDQSLKFLHTSPGRQWMTSEIVDNKYYLHSMICVLQNALPSMICIQCKNTTMIAHVNNKEEVKFPITIKDAKLCAQNFIINMKNKVNSLAQGYKHTPKLFDFFGLGTQPTLQASIAQDDPVYKPPSKRRKAEQATTAATTKPTGGRERPVSFAIDIDKEKKKGILIFTGNKGERLPNFTPFINDKCVCNGNLFVCQHCPRGKDFPCHHDNFVNQLPEVGRKDFIKWVNDKEIKAKWQQGKQPKLSE